MCEYYVELGAASRAALAALDVLKKKFVRFPSVYFCAAIAKQ